MTGDNQRVLSGDMLENSCEKKCINVGSDTNPRAGNIIRSGEPKLSAIFSNLKGEMVALRDSFTLLTKQLDCVLEDEPANGGSAGNSVKENVECELAEMVKEVFKVAVTVNQSVKAVSERCVL